MTLMAGISTVGMIVYGWMLERGWAFLFFSVIQMFIISANGAIWLWGDTLHSYAAEIKRCAAGVKARYKIL